MTGITPETMTASDDTTPRRDGATDTLADAREQSLAAREAAVTARESGVRVREGDEAADVLAETHAVLVERLRVADSHLVLATVRST